MEDKLVQSSQFTCPFDWANSHCVSVYLAELIALFSAVASALVFKQGHHLSAASLTRELSHCTTTKFVRIILDALLMCV